MDFAFKYGICEEQGQSSNSKEKNDNIICPDSIFLIVIIF